MPKLTFRGCQIRSVDFYVQDGQVLTRLHCAADLTEQIKTALELPEVDGLHTGEFEIESLIAENVIFTPNGGAEMKKYETQIALNEMSKLKFARIQAKDGESSHVEIRFILTSGAAGAEATIGEYLRKIGAGDAVAKIDCAQQESLPLEASSEDPPDLEGAALAEHRKLRSGPKARQEAEAAQ